MNKSDYSNLPEKTQLFVNRLVDIGFDRERIFGLFVLIGLYVGGPKTAEEAETLIPLVDSVLPIDRSKNIDEEIGHLYNGFDREINEFCFRYGVDFNFREIKIPNLEKSFYIVYLQDEGLLETNVKSVDQLWDANKLYDSFILALGKNVLKNKPSLLEAYQCGVFQIMLHFQSDIEGSAQVAAVISYPQPLIIAECFKTVITANIDYFLGLIPSQVPLFNLSREMDHEYAKQMWIFQSWLFFRDQKPLDIDKLTLEEWHKWVIKNAEDFSLSCSSQEFKLLPLSSSKLTLNNLPTWGDGIKSLRLCDEYLSKYWGYCGMTLENKFQFLEYRALMAHIVYASLTSSLETFH